jgi:hypothetical protein
MSRNAAQPVVKPDELCHGSAAAALHMVESAIRAAVTSRTPPTFLLQAEDGHVDNLRSRCSGSHTTNGTCRSRSSRSAETVVPCAPSDGTNGRHSAAAWWQRHYPKLVDADQNTAIGRGRPQLGIGIGASPPRGSNLRFEFLSGYAFAQRPAKVYA